jgi:tRNA threonylcarbamoyladenosine biosynthesis protein TsaB
MRVLALDTATEACSAALLSGDGLIGRFSEGGRSHAPQILGMVEAVLAEAGATLSMLDGIVASIGPGAFTGVRISVAVAQGLAFGAGLPVIGATTLEALAFHRMRDGATRALACLDARMGEVYWGCFAADPRRGLAATTAARVGPPENVVLPDVPYWGIGHGFAAYPGLAVLPGLELDPQDSRALPNAREFARLGALRLALGEGSDPADLIPLYLRDKVALTEAERGVK